jgi:voltage-gated potassium channel Kch
MSGAAPATICGATLIILVALDVFDALFHHRGAGLLSGAAMRATWRGVRRVATLRRGLLPTAGPLALVVVITCWLTLLVVGWAIVLWPHIPDGFRFAPGAAAGEGAFVDALYISLVTLATLGFGDVTPATGWLKLVLPLEALVGLGLLTATVSWLLSIHPALSRRRSLAYEIALLQRAEREAASSVLDGAYGEAMLAELTSRLVAVERDFTALPIAYYFAEGDPRFSLGLALPYLCELAMRGGRADMPVGVRLRAAMLAAAIDEFTVTTAERFHRAGARDTAAILDAYARDHLLTTSASGQAPAARTARP